MLSDFVFYKHVQSEHRGDEKKLNLTFLVGIFET